MTPITRILYHGRRPRPARIPKLKRRDVADLLAWLLRIEADRAETESEAVYLDGLSQRAEEIAIGGSA